jgi:hypothetical protein
MTAKRVLSLNVGVGASVLLGEIRLVHAAGARSQKMDMIARSNARTPDGTKMKVRR